MNFPLKEKAVKPINEDFIEGTKRVYSGNSV